MAKKVVTTLVDDIDGTEINDGNGETIVFALDGISYEIDLTAANAAALRKSLAAYVAAARRVKNRTSSSRVRVKPEGRSAELAAIREWARSNGYPAPDRGRIPADTLAAYEAATR